MKTVNNTSIWLPAIFEDLFTQNRLDSFNNYEIFSTPAVNIIENFPNFVVELAAPGFKKEDFKIEVEEDTLIISSKRETELEEKEDSQFVKREFNYESFERSFKLPEDIQTDEILAKYENGVLRVTLPKTEKKKELKRMVEIS